MLTTLGKSSAWPDADLACSGFLYQGEANFLIDCGTGVLGKLQKFIQPKDLDGIFISHFHADHFFDLLPLAHLLHFAPSPQGMPDEKIKLFVPENGRNFLNNFGKSANAENFEKEFDIVEYKDQINFLDIQAKVFLVPHFVPTYGISTNDFTYAADSSAQVILPEDSPLLILEATMPEDGAKGHMSAYEAGAVASKYKAKQLMLTHFSEQYDKDYLINQASKEYSGEIVLAEEGLSKHFDSTNH